MHRLSQGLWAFLGDIGCLRVPSASGITGWVSGVRPHAEVQGFSREIVSLWGYRQVWRVQAGLWIQAGLRIQAGLGVTGWFGIQAGLGVQACLKAQCGLGKQADLRIRAGLGVQVGLG